MVSAAAEVNKRANKQTKLLDLLRRPAGATIAALSNASGWQQHSVRGFLAGVVRKRLGLELVSAVETDQRIYRIVAAKQAWVATASKGGIARMRDARRCPETGVGHSRF